MKKKKRIFAGAPSEQAKQTKKEVLSGKCLRTQHDKETGRRSFFKAADGIIAALKKRSALPVHANKPRAAFTLAEVLIALTVIGIVSALTIPVMMSSEKEKANIAAFKKVYSELAQTSNLLNAENGGDWTVRCSTWDDKCMRDVFAEKLNYIKKCDLAKADGCIASSKYKNGSTFYNKSKIDINGNWPAIITASGFSIKFRMHYNNCMEKAAQEGTTLSCGWSQIDTNGLKGPNTAGKDIFFIHYKSDGSILPPKIGDTIEDYRKECDEIGYSCGTVYMIENK